VTLHSARPTQFLVVSVGQVFNSVHAQHCGIRQRGAALLEGMALFCILLDVRTLVFILKCDLQHSTLDASVLVCVFVCVCTCNSLYGQDFALYK